MRVATPEHTTFETLTFPKTVYKYREASNTIHRTILTEQVVYFAPPTSFEDKLDCKIPIRYDLLTDDEIFDLYIDMFKTLHPEWDELYRRNQATIWTNKGFLHDKNQQEEFDSKYYKDLSERFGILSLTAECANKAMWKKYSANFNGFCIGFDPKIMFKSLGGGGKVHYMKTLPIIKPTDSLESKLVMLTFSKLKKWEFEREYRTQKFWPSPIGNEDRKTKIPKEAFTELILGYNVNIKAQQEIIQLSKGINPDITIKLASIVANKVIIRPFA